MTNDANGAGTDIWQPLGEQKWRELAEGTGASELQLKFAAARFGGASATAAARLSGYSGDRDSLRRAGYSAVRSRAVVSLLELASVASPEDARITPKEIDAKLARLIRSGDPNVVLKAAELHQKREAQRKAESETQKEIISEEEDLANLEKSFPELAKRIRLLKESRQCDHLALPNGKTVGETPDAELYPALVKLGISGLHPQHSRPSLIELFDVKVRKIREDAANRAVDEWLSRKRIEFANAI